MAMTHKKYVVRRRTSWLSRKHYCHANMAHAPDTNSTISSPLCFSRYVYMGESTSACWFLGTPNQKHFWASPEVGGPPARRRSIYCSRARFVLLQTVLCVPIRRCRLGSSRYRIVKKLQQTLQQLKCELRQVMTRILSNEWYPVNNAVNTCSNRFELSLHIVI
jgi:hypothetical protein